MAVGSSDVASAIHELGKAFVRNFNAGEAEELVQGFYAEDARLLPPNHPIVSGRSNIRDFFQGMVDAGVGAVSLGSVDLGASGDLAYQVGTYWLGKPAPDTGKFIEVYRRQADGSWRCVADIFNSDQAPGQG